MIGRARGVVPVGLFCACIVSGAAGHGHSVPAFAELWRVAGAGRGTPVAAGRAAFYLTREREVVALDLPTGAVRWRRAIGRSAVAATLASGSHLMVKDDVVVAGVQELVGIDRATGRVRWRASDADGTHLGTYAGDLVGSLVLCGSAAGRLVAVDWRTGGVVWQRDVAADSRSTVFAPRADARGGVAAFTTFGAPTVGGLVAFDPVSGRVAWRRVFSADSAVGSGWAGGPVLAGALVVLADATGQIVAVDRESGEIKWRIPYVAEAEDRPAVQEFRGLAVAGSTVYASALDGSVVAYRLLDQSRVWRYRDARDGSAGFGLTVDGRWVWCPFIGGLVAIDRDTGRGVWRGPDGARGNARPPFVSPPYLLAAGAGGLLAFRIGERS